MTAAALIKPSSLRYHRLLGCVAPQPRLVTEVRVVTEEMAIGQGKEACGACWRPIGFEPSIRPDRWELE